MDRDAAILDRQVQVRALAVKFWRRCQFLELEDLIQEGNLRLTGAMERYDGSVRLNTFAERQIVGALIDYRRRVDPLTRSQRRRVSAGEELFSIETLDAKGNRPGLASGEESPESVLAGRLEREIFYRLLTNVAFTVQERSVLYGILEGLTQLEIARSIGITQSMASRLRTSIVRKSRRALRTMASCPIAP